MEPLFKPDADAVTIILPEGAPALMNATQRPWNA